MNTRNTILLSSLFVIAFFAGLSPVGAKPASKVDAIRTIFTLENDAVQVDLAGNPEF